MFAIPTTLGVLNILLLISYYYLTVIDRRNATRMIEKLRCEMLEMDQKLIYGYWKTQDTENK